MTNGSSNDVGKVKSKSHLLGGIFAAGALLLLASMLITFRAGHVSIEAQRKMDAQLKVLTQIKQWESTVKDAETGQRGYLLTGEDRYLQPYLNALTNLAIEASALRQMVADGELSGGEMSRTADLIQLKLSELAETLQARKQSGLEAALAIVKTDKGKQTMDQIRASCDDLIQMAQQKYDNASAQADDVNFWRTVLFVVVTILNLGFFAWAFSRISRQEWLQLGHSKLNENVVGDAQLEVMTNKALAFLAEYLHAKVGTIFVEDGGVFRRTASYALARSHGLPDKFEYGEGLIGQAAKDKRAFVVHNIRENHLPVTTGLGTSQPRTLIVAPLKADSVVNAVVELGFSNVAPGGALDLLERVSESLGMAVRSAQYRTRLQELLEETQRQGEELQSQSEELRVSNEELAEQSRALKESHARLEQQQIELEQTNSQLEEQTQMLEAQRSDLVQAKEELENQARLVEQASRYKSDFLANMSHELRTPLNSSLILAKLLADNRGGNLTAEQIKYANTIHSAGHDLLNLINDVLDLAKVEAGKMDLKTESVLVADLLESLRGMFEPMCAAKKLTLRCTIDPTAPESLETDRRRLEQVLKNLLSNAVKFTEKGEVGLDVSRAQNRAVAFAVRDTGIGIAQNQQKIIFEPFRQVDPTPDRKYGGTGLGLSISRELVRLMGGTMTVRSEVDRGSVFTLILPEKYIEPKGGGAASANVVTAVNPSQSYYATPPRPAPARQQKPQLPDDRETLGGGDRVILIVEDDASFAEILRDLAHEMQFQALIGQSAEQALILARQFKPNAVILDIGLPDNSGMFVLERLKADPRTRHIPVHVVSANDYSQPALAMGAVGYMLKPVKRDQLVEAFQKLEIKLTQKLRRVLLVEDDAAQLDSLKELLGSREVETVGARTARECLEKLKEATFDCMVLDLSLPDATGFSLLETLSAEESYSFPPVIIYTGKELTDDEEQKLRKYSKSIIIKGAKSPERLLDEVTLFLHQVVSQLPEEKQRMLEKARSRDAAMEGKRILIVEDDIRNIFALTSLLEPKGVAIEVSRNGREALQALERTDGNEGKRIDLVLMDIMMPEMNGIDAMRAIRKNQKWKDLPIIALTAKAMREDQEKCIEAGANDYLPKPIDVDKLVSLIRIWMPR